MLVIVPSIVLTCLFAPFIIKICFGQSYMPAAGVLQWLVWTLLPLVLGSTFGVLILISAGEYGNFFWTGAAGAVTNFGLNIILIPKYNMYGAALATMVAESIACLVSFYFARKVLQVNLLWNLLFPFCAGLFSLLIYIFIYSIAKGYGPIYCSIISGVSFIIIYFIFLIISEKELVLDAAREILRIKPL
jgi:O-antigen/teichoic acid export membrane protein